ARLARSAQGLVLDPSAGLLLTPEEAADLGAASGIPIGKLVNVHMIEGPDGVWVHTHGAAKLGLPELEAFGVHPVRASDAGHALHRTLEAWARDGSAAPNAEVPLPNGRAIAVIAARGRARPAWARCGEDPPRRFTLVDAEDGRDISRALSGRPLTEGDLPVSPVQRLEAQALLARLRPKLADAPRWPFPEGTRLLCKVGIETADGLELGWVPADRWTGDELSGEPRPGERVSWPVEAVLGAILVRNGIPLTAGEIAKLADA
ncbi:MAG TPA: hypothetical protein VHF22_13755, partial [Planctomycetota bacterium]|nr:hypothetical protein [Planctomycetota bacterium]